MFNNYNSQSAGPKGDDPARRPRCFQTTVNISDAVVEAALGTRPTGAERESSLGGKLTAWLNCVLPDQKRQILLFCEKYQMILELNINACRNKSRIDRRANKIVGKPQSL